MRAAPSTIAAGRLLVLLALSGAGQAIAASTLYCCLDEKGKQVCGDLLPQACVGRAYRELGSSGRTIRNVDAPLSAEQRARQAAEEEARKEQEVALAEQKRKDSALLNTYGSEQDIEVMRGRAEHEVRLSIKSAEAKIAEALKRRKKFEAETEFYQKKPLPAEIAKGLRDIDYEVKAQESAIAAKQKELEIIGLKYETDKRRYLELTRRR